mgnify:CR=1 FL=1
MKALPLVLLVMGMTSSLAVAQVSQVTLTMSSSNQYLIRNDFIGSDESMALATLIGGQVPPGSQFIRFDAGQQAYLPTITRDRSGSWGPGGTTVLERGVAYWLRIPPQGGLVVSSHYQVTLSGTIPAAATTVPVRPQANPIGYPYPVTQYWTNTQLAKSCPQGSSVSFWDPISRIFSTAARGTRAWVPATNKATAGQGYFVNFKSLVPTNIVEPLPY